METETWQPILNYEGSYEVSNLGRIRSLNRETHLKSGNTLQLYGKPIKTRQTKKGETLVNLSRQGYSRTHRVKTLVYEAFHGPLPKGYVLRVKNNDPFDLRLENIEAVTYSTLRKEQQPKTKNEPYQLEMRDPVTYRLIRRFESITEACIYLQEKSPSNIEYALQGIHKTAYGYVWKKVSHETSH